MSNVENEFLIDLSSTKTTAQLASELSTILESDDSQEKNVVLKLGDLNLKQSQLLSIKALIESTDSSISSIYTDSAMTEASAISLGITIKTDVSEEEIPQEDESFQDMISNHIEDLNDTFATVNEQETMTDVVSDPTVETTNTEIITEMPEKKDISENEILKNPDVQAALDKALGLKDNITNGIVKTITNFQKESNVEETVTNERSSEGKYVLLDTEGITPEDVEESSDNTADLPTLYLYQTLRSGQTVSYEGNILIVGDTHPGSEVIATGDITVWGIIGGIVHAGSKGNVTAKVRALKLNPIQLRIAGLYSRRNDTVNVPYIQRSNEFTPEEARIDNKQIVVYKTLRRED